MDAKEKLVELINDCRAMEGYGMDLVEKQADYLIANGITVQDGKDVDVLTKWISVGDGLPEECKTVLAWVYDFDNGMAYTALARYCCWKWGKENKDGWYVCKNGTSDVACRIHEDQMKVTHWAHLPQPPKGE